jgi:hypothetical protein
MEIIGSYQRPPRNMWCRSFCWMISITRLPPFITRPAPFPHTHTHGPQGVCGTPTPPACKAYPLCMDIMPRPFVCLGRCLLLLTGCVPIYPVFPPCPPCDAENTQPTQPQDPWDCPYASHGTSYPLLVVMGEGATDRYADGFHHHDGRRMQQPAATAAVHTCKPQGHAYQPSPKRSFLSRLGR